MLLTIPLNLKKTVIPEVYPVKRVLIHQTEVRNEKLISCILSHRFFVCLRSCSNGRIAGYVKLLHDRRRSKKQVRMVKLLIFHSLGYISYFKKQLFQYHSNPLCFLTRRPQRTQSTMNHYLCVLCGLRVNYLNV